MRKMASAFLAVIVFATCLFSGCAKVSNDPFSRDDFTMYITLHGGIRKIDDTSLAMDVAQFFTRLNSPSSYFVSKNQGEALTIFSEYLNRNNFYPTAVPTDLIIAVTKQHFGEAVYEADCCYMVMNSKDEAGYFYDAYVDNYMSSKNKNKTGKKNGYAYAISYSGSANRAGNCDWRKGVYWKGNTILIITGWSPIGQETFLDYMYEHLRVPDPMTLK
jgi:hypothetical protein